jgi:hypothetical protein
VRHCKPWGRLPDFFLLALAAQSALRIDFALQDWVPYNCRAAFQYQVFHRKAEKVQCRSITINLISRLKQRAT